MNHFLLFFSKERRGGGGELWALDGKYVIGWVVT
jgi:hypothetical protein